MKKIVVTILLLLVIAGVGAPFVTGILMEKTVKQKFASLNSIYKESGADVAIEIIRYDRKFSSSEIEWRMSLGSLEPIYGIKEVVFIDRAKHGYTGITSLTSLEKNSWYADFVSNKLGGKDPLTISTEYKLAGPITSDVKMESFALSVDEETIDVKAGTMVASADADFVNFSSEGSWGGLTVVDKMEFDSVFMNYQLKRISTYLWDGTLSYGIEKMKAQEGERQIELTHFKGDYTLDVDEKANTISVGMAFGLGQLVGAPMQIDDGYVRIGFNNLDGEGFEKFMIKYAEMANDLFKDMGGAEDDPEKMATIVQEQMGKIQLQLMTAYEQLLKKDLEFQISDLHATLPLGEVKGALTLRLNKDMTFAEFFPLLQQPELVTEIFSFASDVSLPAALVGDNPMLLTPVYPGMQGGLFVQKGEMLLHKGETRDGKLYVNDLELQL